MLIGCLLTWYPRAIRILCPIWGFPLQAMATTATVLNRGKDILDAVYGIGGVEMMETLLLPPPSRSGNRDIIVDHYGPFLAHSSSSTPPPHTRATCYALLGAYADWLLIGAWNPRLWLIRGLESEVVANSGLGIRCCG